jgi:hypothetical protein
MPRSPRGRSERGGNVAMGTGRQERAAPGAEAVSARKRGLRAVDDGAPEGTGKAEMGSQLRGVRAWEGHAPSRRQRPPHVVSAAPRAGGMHARRRRQRRARRERGRARMRGHPGALAARWGGPGPRSLGGGLGEGGPWARWLQRRGLSRPSPRARSSASKAGGFGAAPPRGGRGRARVDGAGAADPQRRRAYGGERQTGRRAKARNEWGNGGRLSGPALAAARAGSGVAARAPCAVERGRGRGQGRGSQVHSGTAAAGWGASSRGARPARGPGRAAGGARVALARHKRQRQNIGRGGNRWLSRGVGWMNEGEESQGKQLWGLWRGPKSRGGVGCGGGGSVGPGAAWAACARGRAAPCSRGRPAARGPGGPVAAGVSPRCARRRRPGAGAARG